jgi:hypothetical protein
MEYTKEECYDFLIKSISFDAVRDFSGTVNIRGRFNNKEGIAKYIYESVLSERERLYKEQRIRELEKELLYLKGNK